MRDLIEYSNNTVVKYNGKPIRSAQKHVPADMDTGDEGYEEEDEE